MKNLLWLNITSLGILCIVLWFLHPFYSSLKSAKPPSKYFNHLPTITTPEYLKEKHSEKLEKFLMKYRTLHHSILKGEAPFRIVVFECLNKSNTTRYYCGGVGDRLKGLAASLVFAILSKRALLINIRRSGGLEAVFAPNMIAWNLTESIKDERNANDMAHWINDIIKSHTAGLEFPPLLPNIAHLVENPDKYPLKIIRSVKKSNKRAQISALAELFSNRTSLRLQTNYDTIIEEMKPHVTLFTDSKWLDADFFHFLNSTKSDSQLSAHLLRYLLIPNANVMMRLQMTSLDLAKQFHERKVHAKNQSSLDNSLIANALEQFTSTFYTYWEQRKPRLRTRSNLFRRLINQISTFYYEKPQLLQHIIGAHFRAGGSQSGFRDKRFIHKEDFLDFKHLIAQHARTEAKSLNTTMVILMTDDSSVRTESRGEFNCVTFTSPSLRNDTVVHVDLSKKVSPIEITEVFTELLLFGLCDSLVLTGSGFSKVGWHLPMFKHTPISIFTTENKTRIV